MGASSSAIVSTRVELIPEDLLFLAALHSEFYFATIREFGKEEYSRHPERFGRSFTADEMFQSKDFFFSTLDVAMNFGLARQLAQFILHAFLRKIENVLARLKGENDLEPSLKLSWQIEILERAHSSEIQVDTIADVLKATAQSVFRGDARFEKIKEYPTFFEFVGIFLSSRTSDSYQARSLEKPIPDSGFQKWVAGALKVIGFQSQLEEQNEETPSARSLLNQLLTLSHEEATAMLIDLPDEDRLELQSELFELVEEYYLRVFEGFVY